MRKGCNDIVVAYEFVLIHLSDIEGHPGPEVIKLISCSTHLSMTFQMLISIKKSRNLAYIRLR